MKFACVVLSAGIPSAFWTNQYTQDSFYSYKGQSPAAAWIFLLELAYLCVYIALGSFFFRFLMHK